MHSLIFLTQFQVVHYVIRRHDTEIFNTFTRRVALSAVLQTIHTLQHFLLAVKLKGLATTSSSSSQHRPGCSLLSCRAMSPHCNYIHVMYIICKLNIVLKLDENHYANKNVLCQFFFLCNRYLGKSPIINYSLITLVSTF